MAWSQSCYHHWLYLRLISLNIIWPLVQRSEDTVSSSSLGQWATSGPFATSGRLCRQALLAARIHIVFIVVDCWLEADFFVELVLSRGWRRAVISMRVIVFIRIQTPHMRYNTVFSCAPDRELVPDSALVESLAPLLDHLESVAFLDDVSFLFRGHHVGGDTGHAVVFDLCEMLFQTFWSHRDVIVVSIVSVLDGFVVVSRLVCLCLWLLNCNLGTNRWVSTRVRYWIIVLRDTGQESVSHCIMRRPILIRWWVVSLQLRSRVSASAANMMREDAHCHRVLHLWHVVVLDTCVLFNTSLVVLIDLVEVDEHLSVDILRASHLVVI